MIVLRGQLAVTGVDGDSVVGPGEVVVLRHGTPFAWRNASSDVEAIYLGVYAPGGFEQYFPTLQQAAADAGGLSPEVIAPLWEQYGIGVSDRSSDSAQGYATSTGLRRPDKPRRVAEARV
jgi:uncharacterized protein YjlB